MKPLVETGLVGGIPATRRTRSRRSKTERILFTFSARERGLFLPGLSEAEFMKHECSYVDTDALDAESWERTLRTFRPTVLVTAWSAPKIPVSWIESGEFSLRYVCHLTGSLRKVMTTSLFGSGVRASNWGTVINHTIAEHAVLLVLALLRGVTSWPEAVAQSQWSVDQVSQLRTRSLRGQRVGLHGFGAIGREIIKLVMPFQPAVISAYSHGVPPAFMAAQGVTPCRNLEELFANCDVLIECESLTPLSTGSVDASLLARLPDDAVFVNVGRGAVVAESALLSEAASGRLRVGLDVFHREPLPQDSPLRKAPRVLLSPHIAGPTSDTFHLCGAHALENLRRYLDGRPLSGEVTAEIFERMT